MDTKKRSYDIMSGPSRAQLIDAFQYQYDNGVKMPIEFQIALAYTRATGGKRGFYPMKTKSDVLLTGIKHEDGSGHSFIIAGYISADARIVKELVVYKRYRFEAYYNAQTRRGRITLFEE